MDDKLNSTIRYIKRMLIWMLCSAVVGAVCGLVGSGFYLLINASSAYFLKHSWIIWLLPAGGIVVNLLYLWARKGNDDGTNTVIRSVRNKDEIPWVMFPLIFIGTWITRLFGGSVGTEGAAIQIGGSIGSALGGVFHLTPDDKKILIMSGISGGFAAIVGTPVTAIVLAIEIAGIGIIFYSAIMPCAIASVTAFAIATAFHIDFPRYTISQVPALGPASILKVVVLAALCGLVSILFCVSLDKSKLLLSRAFPNAVMRVAAGGLIVAVLTAIVGNNLYNGGSLSLTQNAFNGTSGSFDFLWKIIFTSLTIAAGFKGGEIVPTFVIGATFGSTASKFLGLAPAMGTGIGMIAVFCGAVNCPLTAFVFGLEVFGSRAGLFFLVACAVSYVCSGYYGLYSSQKIWYDKLGEDKISANSR